jgi:hypothetical protein
VPNYAIVVVESVGALTTSQQHGIERQTIATFHTISYNYNSVMWSTSMTMISHVACRYYDIFQRPPHLLIKPHQRSMRRWKNNFFSSSPMASHEKSSVTVGQPFK